MLWDRCLSRLSVTLVHCGQTVGLIKMPLGTEVSIGPGDIVLDGDPALRTERGTTAPPLFGRRLGVVHASVVRRMKEVTLHWARLVLGWVTVFGRVYHHGM